MINPQLQQLFRERYQLTQLVARGGMAEVWRATDLHSGVTVAIKLQNSMQPGPLGASPFEPTLAGEYNLLRTLDHPNIVRVHAGAGTQDTPTWYVMDYWPHTLRQRIARLSLAAALRVMGGVCGGLQYLHARGWIHGDVKPMNILLDEAQRPALCDFGITRRRGERALDAEQNIVGSPYFLAPELCQGQPLSAQADLYAAGVILYHMATGRYPYENAADREILEQHVRERPVPVRELNRGISPRLAELIGDCLAKHPADRPGSAAELAEELRAVPELKGPASGQEAAVSTTVPRAERRWKFFGTTPMMML